MIMIKVGNMYELKFCQNLSKSEKKTNIPLNFHYKILSETKHNWVKNRHNFHIKDPFFVMSNEKLQNQKSTRSFSDQHQRSTN